jgi:DNA-binding transcriptional MerR regulator
MSNQVNNTDGHPISVVVRRTGLTQDILRAWEKRYQAVVPLRTDTGRRLYTEDQVAKLRLLKQLVDGGRRISDVAELDLPTLQRLADEDAKEAVAPVTTRWSDWTGRAWNRPSMRRRWPSAGRDCGPRCWCP